VKVTPVRVVWQAMREQRPALTGAALLGFIASASAVALLGTSAWLIATAAGAPPVLTLSVAAVMVRAFALLRAVFRYAERLAGHAAAFRGLTGLRVSVYQQLERLAPGGIARFGRGDLLSRLVADVDTAVDLPLRVVLPWAQAALVVVGSVAFLAWLLPGLAVLITVVGLAALVLVPWIVARVTARAEAQFAPARAQLASSLVTGFTAVADLAALGAQDRALAQLSELDAELTRLGRRESYGLGAAGALMTLVQGAAVVGALLLAVPAVSSGQIDGVWLAVAALLPIGIFDVLATLPGSAIAFQRVRAGAVRIAALDDLPTPVVSPEVPQELPSGFTGIVLEDLSASWEPDGATVLAGVSLTIAPGDQVVLVGPSGAGKSTLAGVLMGFLPYRGSARVNGVEIASADLDQVRERIGLLAQRSHVFDTTIAENITLGRPGLSEAAVTSAVHGAQLDAMVARLPQGTASAVGPFGAAISGGEAQRIALARLMVQPRPCVILDEPTEHLDQAMAREVDQVLADQLSAFTTITITHALLVVPDRARVIELQDGRITAEGTAQDLRAGDSWFAQQWRAQRDISLVAGDRA
jgi:ATP-binding cassette subfamily C protein CydCD